MTDRTYTQEEVEQLLQDQQEKFEARSFKEETGEALKEINRRLTEANGYKNTIGKDVKEVKEEVQDIKRKVIVLEEARAAEAKKVKEELEARQQQEVKTHGLFQDKWMRRLAMSAVVVAALGFLTTTAWEGMNIWLTLQQLAPTARPHG